MNTQLLVPESGEHAPDPAPYWLHVLGWTIAFVTISLTLAAFSRQSTIMPPDLSTIVGLILADPPSLIMLAAIWALGTCRIYLRIHVPDQAQHDRLWNQAVLILLHSLLALYTCTYLLREAANLASVMRDFFELPELTMVVLVSLLANAFALSWCCVKLTERIRLDIAWHRTLVPLLGSLLLLLLVNELLLRPKLVSLGYEPLIWAYLEGIP
jgi:hypothetical protein